MNAGRDVERLIATWLTEEATDRSRDRVLATVHRAIERTPQRRFRVAWREPMYVNPTRLAMMAAALVVAVLGGAVIGRVTAPGGSGGPAPTATASPGPSLDTLLQYRAARNVICNQFYGQGETLKVRLPNIFWDGLSDAERAEKVTALAQLRVLLGSQVEQLAALDAPSEIAVAHQESITRYEDINQPIDEVLRLLDEDDLVGAEAVDLATDPIGDEIEAFERQYAFAPCA